MPPPDALRAWRVPESDRAALAAFGLPDDLVMSFAFQAGPEPSLAPNAAGPREAGLVGAEDRLYDLGRWGSHEGTPKLGLVAGDGRVLAVRPAPVTAADLHPDLREHYRGLYLPAVALVNSSAARLVQTAWRVRAALPPLAAIDLMPEPPPGPSFEAHAARRRACEAMVVAALARIDPAVGADGPDALWTQLVSDPGH